jgi:hypothetical protein
MEPLASIENSKRDHTIFLDNKGGGIFLPKNIQRTNPSLWWHDKFARAAESEQCFSKWEGY